LDSSHPGNVARGSADGLSHLGRDAPRALAQFFGGDFERPGDAVEPPGKRAQRAVAVVPHAIDNLPHAAVEDWIASPAAIEQSAESPGVPRVDDSETVHVDVDFLPLAAGPTPAAN
jgi:hypothetical protein